MDRRLRERVRWGNVARALGVVAVMGVVVAWPVLAPEAPVVPGREAVPVVEGPRAVPRAPVVRPRVVRPRRVEPRRVRPAFWGYRPPTARLERLPPEEVPGRLFSPAKFGPPSRFPLHSAG